MGAKRVTAVAQQAEAQQVRRDKVAILGYTNHRRFAPFHDQEWELWGLNDLYYEIPSEVDPSRWRWFQLHPFVEIAHHKEQLVTANPMNFAGGPPHPRDPNHVPWLAEAAKNIPVYLFEPRPEVPDARVLPKEDLRRFFSLDRKKEFRYFTNSISWMLALAIYEGFKEIAVYGVDMMMGGGEGSEYGYQRPSCEFFLGAAWGRGIKVIIPDESDLLHAAFEYGDGRASAFRQKVRSVKEEYQQRRAEAQGTINQAQAANSELTGAISAMEFIERNWMPGDTDEPQAGTVPLPNAHKGLRPVAPQMPPRPVPLEE